MARIVTALFATRGEAETARARLASTVRVEFARVVGQDTAGALVGLPVQPDHLRVLREALARGDYVMLASVAPGADPARIVDALGVPAEEPQEDGPRLSYSIGPTPAAQREPRHIGIAPADRTEEQAAPAVPSPAPAQPSALQAETPSAATPAEPPSRAAKPPAAEAERPVAAPDRSESDEVRIGTSQLYRGGGERISQTGDFESRAPARRLTDEEVQAGGLLKDRVIEVIEMREEPVISREVVVREEVLIRKTVSERNETVHDSVRRTEVEVEDLPPRK